MISLAVSAWHFSRSTHAVCWNCDFPDPGTTHIQVIGLDEWRFRVGGDGASFVASPNSFAVVSVGVLAQRLIPTFFEKLRIAFCKTQSRTGDKRSAAGRQQGNSRTPILIEAVARDALYATETGEDIEVESPTRGGFTDVGLHTGGAPRDTAWPLVCALIEATAARLSYDRVLIQVCVFFQGTAAFNHVTAWS